MPNIKAIQNLQGESVAGAVSATSNQNSSNALALVTGVADNTPNTGDYTTLKVNTLIIANTHASTAAVVSIEFDSGTPRTFVNAVSIPAGASLDVLSGPIYVNAPESLNGFVTGADVTFLVSYEKLVSNVD